MLSGPHSKNAWLYNAIALLTEYATANDTLYHEVAVEGTSTLDVYSEHVYELTGSSTPVVSLSGKLGTQVVIRWHGAAGKIEGTDVVEGKEYICVNWKEGWTVYTVGATTPDPTGPTAGTLVGSSITSTGFTLTVSGASDPVELHASPYRFSTDNGATWTAYQSSAVYVVTGKSATTGYQCVAQVRNAAGATALTAVITVTTISGASWQTVAKDSFNGTDGTALTAHTSETGGVTYTGSQAGPKILSNKVDVYPYGNTQNSASSVTTGLGAKFRASLGYVIPALHPDSTRTVSLYIHDGVSAANGAGQFHARVGIDLPSADSANGGLSGTSTYDGALTLTPVGGQNLNLVPLSGTLGISMDAGVLSVLINGTVWATVAAPAGCSFGSSVSWVMEPPNLYNGPHWQADDYLVEKYA